MPPPSRTIGRALVGGVVLAVLTTGCTSGRTPPSARPGTSTPSTSPTTTATSSTATIPPTKGGGRATTVAPAAPVGPVTLLGGLDIAWSVAVLPDGSALVSERNTGRVHHVPKPGSGGRPTVAGRLPITRTDGEGGLLGIAVPVDFDADPVVYAYYSTESDNRVAAVPWRDGLGEPVVIFSGIPNATTTTGVASPSAPTATSTSPRARPATRRCRRISAPSAARSFG